MEERSREHFTMFRCLIHHQCNTERRWKKGPGNILQCSGALFIISLTRSGVERRWKKGPGNIVQCSGALSIISVTRSGAERNGAEMEERSREHFTMFRCVIHHQCNTERSRAERSGDGRKVQGTFYNVQVPYPSSV
jgi:hypothetical protein